jgi:hypothetical protein
VLRRVSRGARVALGPRFRRLGRSPPRPAPGGRMLGRGGSRIVLTRSCVTGESVRAGDPGDAAESPGPSRIFRRSTKPRMPETAQLQRRMQPRRRSRPQVARSELAAGGRKVRRHDRYRLGQLSPENRWARQTLPRPPGRALRSFARLPGSLNSVLTSSLTSMGPTCPPVELRDATRGRPIIRDTVDGTEVNHAER